jgi:hypothetical protein
MAKINQKKGPRTKDRKRPIPKQDSKSWQRRNANRKKLQDAHAEQVKLSQEIVAEVIAEEAQ